jgi:hypothetical protein
VRSRTSFLKRSTSSRSEEASSSVSETSLRPGKIRLQAVDHRFKRLVMFAGARLHAHDDVAVHLDEAAVAVVGEALVGAGGDEPCTVSSLRPRLRMVSIMPGIESRDPERTAKTSGIGEAAEAFAENLFNARDGVVDLRVDFLRQGFAVLVEPGADLRGDGEAGRHRQPDAGHFREVRALAAEERLHLAVAVAAAVAEEINQLCPFWPWPPRGRCGPRPGFTAAFFADLPAFRELAAALRRARRSFFFSFFLDFLDITKGIFLSAEVEAITRER